MDLRGSLRAEGSLARSILTSFLVVVVTAFLWVLLGSTTPVAAADATWEGASILHEGRRYIAQGEAKATPSLNLPDSSAYYLTIEGSPGATTVTPQKAHVIYFAPGADPPTKTTATYVAYSYNSSTKEFSNPSSPQEITLEAAGPAGGYSSCTIEGVGWIVCSVSVFLAQAMDWIFETLTLFMSVQPITVGDTDNPLYVTWNVMRSFANVAFIIVFLIIIYSQLTSAGVSNYGLKRILPRLIIGALLVNLSYIISAVAVDISNVLGYSLQDVFIQLRDGLFYIDGESWSEVLDWESIVEFVLSGGAAGLAVGAGVGTAIAANAAVGGTAAGAIYLILPALVGLLLTVIVVVLILAARQALIIILVIISPLAFVAYLLPNTEKWFDKWKDVFMTMLIFFPAFSVVFGGSQLAGAVIIQNATSISIIILGMAVQVAPLVITPLILKFSGNLLGKVAGIVNNPSKGILDRTRNWSNAQREYHRHRGVSGMKLNGQPGELKGRNFARRAARATDHRKRRLETRTKNATAHADNAYLASKKYKPLHEGAYEIGKNKETIDNEHEEHINSQVSTTGSRLYKQNISHEEGKRRLERSKAVVDTSVKTVENNQGSNLHLENIMMEQQKAKLEEATAKSQRAVDEYKSGSAVIRPNTPNSQRLTTIAQAMNRSYINLSAETRAGVAAKHAQQQSYAEALKAEPALQNNAGGIDPNGAQRAFTEAITIISKNRQENIQNAKTILDYNNLDDDKKLKLINGQDVGNVKSSVDMRAAALESLLEGAAPPVILNAIETADFNGLSASDREDLYATMGSSLASSKMRPAFMGFGVLAKMKQGLNPNGTPITGPQGKSGLQSIIIKAIEDQTITPGAMQEMFSPYVKAMFEAVKDNNGMITPAARKRLKDNLDIVLDSSRPGYEKLGDSLPVYQEMRRIL
ncbi:hypothetical protein GW746_00125 [Candidatus Saccharibacteria bacterium]|nr:hypothetical protein [Candidatus Saccharibacteria bacterium]NCS82811.1 hypothetical protein [Candidatus Saccharibacteria bacterium]